MDDNVSLADLLGFDENVAEPLRARVRKLAERWPLPAGKLRASAVEQVVERVRERLSPRLYRVLASAWRHHPACQAFCDAEKYPPNEVNTVELAAHNVEWACEPAVEVVADGLQATGLGRLAQLEFKVQVVAALRGGVVTIQDGRFMRMDAADLTLSAELSVETYPVVDIQVPVRLPGTIRFGEHGEPICLPEPAESQAPAQIAVPAIANAGIPNPAVV
ncbi:hypothetical protein [Longimicrobium sp.]|uniref:hypothetical protein n=1 Tax=Longimicrobium sp. TaxID=2029185 RepID=UPI002E3630B1|nr:hypothetical protein [Longimicrobium sp.]HEX6040674.1 hypothetical protein [Longimicrobium sp.]